MAQILPTSFLGCRLLISSFSDLSEAADSLQLAAWYFPVPLDPGTLMLGAGFLSRIIDISVHQRAGRALAKPLPTVHHHDIAPTWTRIEASRTRNHKPLTDML